MTQPIEIIGDSLRGPYTIKIDGHVVENVQDFELYNQDGANILKLEIITDNFQIKRSEVKPKFACGGIVHPRGGIVV